MDLPTYTNIWRIEKRLYKLYDLRLPMPLPLGQIAAFVGITVPYVLFLTLIGVPFSHNLFWLYVLPPGVLTWLVTRPVLENKKLPELLVSQVRYLGEPKIWCRMAPATEKDEIVVVGQVWHACPQPAAQAAAVEIRAPVPRYPRACPPGARVLPGQPAGAVPASGRQGPPADLRHRNPAAWGPRPAVPAVGRIAVPDRRAATGYAPQRARAGAGPAPDRHMVARGAPPRQRPAAPARPQRRPVRPAASAPQRGQQPAWVTRARPGGAPRRACRGGAQAAGHGGGARRARLARARCGRPDVDAGPGRRAAPRPRRRTQRRRRSPGPSRRGRPGTRAYVPASGSRRTRRIKIGRRDRAGPAPGLVR